MEANRRIKERPRFVKNTASRGYSAIQPRTKWDKSYWAEAFVTAADIRNVLLSKSNDQTTPYELATNKKPDMEHMRTFGSIGYAHVPKQKRKKLHQHQS